MEVPFYFTVKEFKEKYFGDFNKYREYNNVTLVEFLELVFNRLGKEYAHNEKEIELYYKQGKVEIDDECILGFLMEFYTHISKDTKLAKLVYPQFKKGKKEDIERYILKCKLGIEDRNFIDIINNNDHDDYVFTEFRNISLSLIMQIQCEYLSEYLYKEIEKEKYHESLSSNKVTDIVEQDFSNNESKEKVILLEKIGIIDFIKEKQSNPNNIKQTAEILSSFTGIKSATLYSYLRPMLSPHRDDTDKNSPYKNPENLQRANKTLHKLPIK